MNPLRATCGLLLIFVCARAPLAAQTPSIASGGIVNAATFAPRQPVCPGSLATIFGTNLAPGTAQAASIPLPVSLNGVAVTFNGLPAPLLFVSPNQINLQVPWEALPSGTSAGTAAVVVTVNGASSVRQSVPLAAAAPAVFTFEFGSGQAVAVNLDATVTAVESGVAGLASHSAAPGDIILLYATGLGPVDPPAATGNNSVDRLRPTVAAPGVLIGGQSAQVLFAGLSPDFVGVYQLNVVVPQSVPTGDAVPVQIQAGGVTATGQAAIGIRGNTPSTAPSLIFATAVTSSQINLTWNPPVSGSNVTYRLYRNGAPIAAPKIAFYADTGLAAAASYTYTVAAVDASGTESSLSPAVSATTASALPAPAAYQDLYDQLSTKLTSIHRQLDSLWDGSRPGINFSAELYPADGGPGILAQPQYFQNAVVPYLDALQSIGVSFVRVAILFPVLYPPFAGFQNNPQQYQQYLNFYIQVANEVRRRGLKLIVHSEAAHPGDLPNITQYYSSLTFQQFAAARSQQLQTIAGQIKPDYLILQAEPSTEAADTGKLQILDPATDASMVSTFASDVKAANPNVIAGAGVGTWMTNYAAFINAFTQIQALDMIDMHVYPVNDGYIDRALQIADTARSSGKRVSMSEAWLYKIRDSELAQGFTSTAIYSRDVYSFWAPLDQQFLAAMVKFAYLKHLEFMNPFFDKYYYTYLDYGQVASNGCGAGQSCSAAQLIDLSNASLCPKLIVEHHVTGTGLAYSRQIR
ncbi:MAG TPA: hypothetical protein VFA33_03385 [Bryobacteraceae bacterium]|nr:hypothetical protein [Bryobacteraceae bacterium]